MRIFTRIILLNFKLFLTCVSRNITQKDWVYRPTSKMSRTPWECLEAYPPPYCRLLAKEPGGGSADMSVTDAELAIRSGIPLSRVREISRMESWVGVPVDEVRRFLAGCNFDPTNPVHRQRVRTYEKQCTKRKSVPFHYLRRSPKWETEFLPLLLLVSRIMKSQSELLPATAKSVTHARS